MKPSKTADFILSDSILTGALIESRQAGYTFPPHLHSVIEIYRILSGECYMNIESAQVSCKEGDFIMVLPNVVHSLFLDDSSDCTFIHIHFNPAMFASVILQDDGVCPVSLMDALLFSSHFYYRFPSDAALDDNLNKLINLHSASTSLFTAANVDVTLINMVLHILDHNSTNNLSATSLQSSYVVHAMKYIHENYMHKIKQEEIASQLHISVRYLSKLFKTYIGIPMSVYITNYRINQSIKLMQDTNLTLTDIAFFVGFSNSQHFSKAFISIINETPSQYRKHLLNN